MMGEQPPAPDAPFAVVIHKRAIRVGIAAPVTRSTSWCAAPTPTRLRKAAVSAHDATRVAKGCDLENRRRLPQTPI
jgi:hypothetical protein